MNVAEEGSEDFRRIMIVGVSGYVGSALALGLRDDYEVLGSYHEHAVRIEGTSCFPMNCLKGGEILNAVHRYRPDAIIYAIGLSRTRDCQTNETMADALNYRAATLFFKVLPKPVPFIFLSTDRVFGERSEGQAPYTEANRPEPMSVVGSSRLRGESLTMGHRRLTYVFRLSKLYGETLGGPHFPRANWTYALHEALAQGKPMAFSQQRRSFTYVGDVVRAVKAFFQQVPEASTLYHLSASPSMTWFEFARFYAETLGFSPDLIREGKVPLSEFAAQDSSLSAQLFEEKYQFRFQPPAEGLLELSERLRTGHTKGWI